MGELLYFFHLFSLEFSEVTKLLNCHWFCFSWVNHFHLFSMIFSPCLLLYLKNFTTVLHRTNTRSTTLSWEDGLFCFVPGEVLDFNFVKSPMTKLKVAENQHPTKNKSPQRRREPAFPIKQKHIRLPRSDDTVGQQHVIERLWCVYFRKGKKSHEHCYCTSLFSLNLCQFCCSLNRAVPRGVAKVWKTAVWESTGYHQIKFEFLQNLGL